MSYKTNPSFNRLKVIKGWKNPYLPTKTSNYARDISLWFKVYLLLKTFLNLKKIQLFSFEIRFDQQNKKILYLVINKKHIQRKKRKKKKKVSLKKVKTPIQKWKNSGAMFFLFQNLNLLKKYSFWNKNVVQKKILSKFWLTKPKTFTWINHLENLVHQHQNLKKKNCFLKKNQSFTPKQHLKFKLFTLKQKQILSQKRKIKKINTILYTKLFGLFHQKKSEVLLKVIQNLQQKIESNQRAIKKIEKLYTFLLFWNNDFSKKKKKDLFKNSTRKKFQRQKLNLLLKEFKPEFSSLKRALNKNSNTIFQKKTALFLRNAMAHKPLLKRKSFLKKICHLNFLITQMQKKNRYFQNYFLYSSSDLKKKRERNKEKNSGKTFFENAQLKNLFRRKYRKILKKDKIRYDFYKTTIWFFLRHKRKTKRNFSTDFRKKKKLRWKKKVFHTYWKFLKKKKFKKKKRGVFLAKEIKKINRYIKKNRVVRDYQYRIPSRKTYFTFLQFTSQLRLKYLIQNFVQKYFSIPVEAKVIHFLNAYKNKKYFRLVFPVWRKKKKQMIKKFRQRIWKQKQIFLATRLQLLTPAKKKTQEKVSLFLNEHGKTLNKKKTYLLRRRKIKSSRIQNGFKRMKGGKDFRHSFKYFLPTLIYLSRTLDPQPLADLLAKVVYKAKKQTWMLSTVREILKILRLGKNVGYKVALAGRINSADKSRLIYITRKNVPLQVFDKNMNFAYAQAKARIGVFGIKIWIYF